MKNGRRKKAKTDVKKISMGLELVKDDENLNREVEISYDEYLPNPKEAVFADMLP